MSQVSVTMKPMGRAVDPMTRFLAKVEIASSGCWLWTASCNSDGYGHFKVNGTMVGSHRWYYEQTVGAVPQGLQLDHLCRVRRCVNPDHLEPVTPRENVLRGESLQSANARKTHCAEGHPLDHVDARGARQCGVCLRTKRRERKRAWRAANLDRARATDAAAARRRRAEQRQRSD